MKIADLSKEFPKGDIHWRVQGMPYERSGKFSAMALAYIDARDVMDRLDEVCGPENWQDKYDVTPNGLIICRIGVRVGDDWVWKSDGAGETAVEGKKGGMSDALKRCAVKWGIGRYLYRLDSPWVQCEVSQKNGKTYWKKWAEDPWSKVKQTTYHAAENSQQEAEKKAREVRAQSEKVATFKAQMIAKMAGAPSADLVANDDGFKSDLAELRDMDPIAASDVEAALEEKRAA